MSRWKFCSILILVLVLNALGCGSGASSTVSVTVSPSPISVITNTTQQFSAFVTGSSNMTVTWTVTCTVVGSQTATGCGTIDANGLYTAPATLPTLTISGTVTPEPTATITATSAADTTKTATATVTIITGISISITPTTATIGTGEHFTFTATVNNPGCNTTSNSTCLNVTWSLPTTPTGLGSIDANGVYTAPTTAPSPSSVIVTATSVADTSITATATVIVVTASDPTVSFVSPSNAALGSLFQDAYVTGTNFLSTSVVYVNGSLLDATAVSDVSNSVIRFRITPNLLVAPGLPPSGILAVTVSQQVGKPQSCTDPALCQIVVSGVRPAIVGPSPDALPQSQNSSSVQTFNVNGGFFGTPSSPSVSTTYDGKSRVAQVTSNTTRQLSVSIGGNSNSQDFSQAGLHQITIRSNGDPTKFASTNLAVQPDVNANPPSTSGAVGGAMLPVGTTPSDVAINPATGMAVVANSGSNDVTLIDLSGTNPIVLLPSLCTGAMGKSSAPCSATSGPKGVAVAHLISPTQKNIALVANGATKTISEIDLDAQSVIWVSPTLLDPPLAVGINPVTGRALVAMNTRPYGLIVDLTQNPPAILGPVSITTGPNAHVAVEPHLNWALATPGGNGSLSIVDLNRQSTNNITNVSRATNVVTVTYQASTPAVPQSPVTLVDGDAVQIQGVSDNSFNGIYIVSQTGPGNTFKYSQTSATLPDVASLNTAGTINYAEPVALLTTSTVDVQGIGINSETETAVLADPTANGPVSFFSLIDQTVTPLSLTNSSGGVESGSAFAAFNQLTDTAYVVNPNNSTLSVIDPTTPKRLPAPTTTFPTGPTPAAVAVDPASNRLVVVNQGSGTGANMAWIYSLGSTSTIRPIAITETNPKIFVANSTLTTAAAPAALTLAVIGRGLTCSSNSTTLAVRLDGVPLSTACATSSGDRGLTAIVPPSLLAHARRFTVDVQDSVSGTVSNASDFTVEQSIDVTGCSASPSPSGVAVDAQQNIAAVSLAGCNQVALISLSNGTGQSVSVGSTPLGVGVIPRLHEAVVANNGSNNVSVVDELGASVVNTIGTGTGPEGVATDQDTGEAAVANTVTNTVSVINVTSGASSSITTDSRPVAVGFNYQNHTIAVAADSSNTQGSVDIADAAGSSASQTFTVNVPTSVVYDPITGDLGNDCGTSTNVVGCFLVNSSTGNNLNILDPTTQSQTTFRIGINPTAIAYNYLTSTVVSTNTESHTVTVGDFLDPAHPRGIDAAPGADEFNSVTAGSPAIRGGYPTADEPCSHRGHRERACPVRSDPTLDVCPDPARKPSNRARPTLGAFGRIEE